MADCRAKEILKVTEKDIFVGSPPLAFTISGSWNIFKIWSYGNITRKCFPQNMIEIIIKYKATICFTAPTAYNFMLIEMEKELIYHL